MKRDEVKIGTEYAVRRGNYGEFARVKIIEPTERETRTYSYGQRRTERGFKGKIIEPSSYGGYGAHKGSSAFVRPRDVSHEWTAEEESRERQREHEAKQAAELKADVAERRDLAKRIKALGLDSGIVIEVPEYRYAATRTEKLAVNREALAALIDFAEGMRQTAAQG